MTSSSTYQWNVRSVRFSVLNKVPLFLLGRPSGIDTMGFVRTQWLSDNSDEHSQTIICHILYPVSYLHHWLTALSDDTTLKLVEAGVFLTPPRLLHAPYSNHTPSLLTLIMACGRQ